jgi:transcription elongation factor
VTVTLLLVNLIQVYLGLKYIYNIVKFYVFLKVVRYQENEGIVLKLVPNVSSKLSKEFSESKATYTACDRFH